MEIRLVTDSKTLGKGEISVTAHLEPEGDGSHEKVITQTDVSGVVLPPGTRLELVPGVFTPEQEARIRQIVQEMLPKQ